MPDEVLIVEDYADLRAAVVSVLSRARYVCDQARSSDEAVARLRTHHYHTVLLSPRLPLAEDPVVRYLLAEDAAHTTRVILMTEPGQPTGDYHALTKPFNREQLVAQMNG